MNLRTGYFSALVLIGLLVCAENNYACFTAPPSDSISNTKEYNLFVRDYNRAPIVFSGKVIEIDRFRVKFKVERIWKGNIAEEYIMSTGTLPRERGSIVSKSSCDYKFTLGKSCVVYTQPIPFTLEDFSDRELRLYGAIPAEFTNLLRASKSGRTKPLEEAKQGIENLNKLTKPKKLKY